MSDDNTSPDRPAVEPMALTKAQLCKALNISPVTAWRLERRGLLRAVPGIRHKLYSVAAIKRFLEGKAST